MESVTSYQTFATLDIGDVFKRRINKDRDMYRKISETTGKNLRTNKIRLFGKCCYVHTSDNEKFNR